MFLPLSFNNKLANCNIKVENRILILHETQICYVVVGIRLDGGDNIRGCWRNIKCVFFKTCTSW